MTQAERRAKMLANIHGAALLLKNAASYADNPVCYAALVNMAETLQRFGENNVEDRHR